jgi:hypothetical protein
MSDLSDRDWALEPFSVHVAASAALASQLEHAARRAGAGVIHLDLSGVEDRMALGDRLAEVFMFPHRTRGLDAAIDLISDLEWFGNSSGYLVTVDAADTVRRNVLADFAGILPAILDRWRTQGNPFVVVLVGVTHRQAALPALARANSKLAEFAKLPWAPPGTGPVTVLDHGMPHSGPPP